MKEGLKPTPKRSPVTPGSPTRSGKPVTQGARRYPKGPCNSPCKG